MGAVEESSAIVTAMVSYAEARAAFARLLREERLSRDQHEGIVAALDARWRTYQKPPITEDLIHLSGDLAQRYALRGYDAIQLASASVYREEHWELRFLAFDEGLNDAARQIMDLYTVSRPDATENEAKD